MSTVFEEQIERSALWAAYGDIVGFPSELISESEFTKKNSIRSIIEPIEWSRRVGGIFGPDITFPRGSYSDDTQLRLSTCRSIRGDGFFDVDSFAKIELPVWLNYALGAGRGSKAAAANLALKESTWYKNFFSTTHTNYCNGGGNGAVMRIQPHVWALHKNGLEAILPDVIRNTICTHGHPRAIIGSAIHAAFLLQTLNSKKAISPQEWEEFGVNVAAKTYETLIEDEELSLIWIPTWEQLTERKLKNSWADTISEWVNAAQLAAHESLNTKSNEKTYKSILTELGGFNPSERGSGLKTPLYASVLAWLYREEATEAPLLLSANTFNSDTDSIGTVTGALVGAISSYPPPNPIQDRNYITEEARRLFRISTTEKQSSFNYPDILSWTPPKNQSSAWTIEDGDAKLAGLGKLSLYGNEYINKKGPRLIWKWCTLPFGQTVLAKRRDEGDVQQPAPKHITTSEQHSTQGELPIEETPLARTNKPRSIDEHTNFCIKSKFDPLAIGESLLELSSGEDGIEKAIAFAAVIAKAKIARSMKQ